VGQRNYQAEADEYLARATQGLEPQEAALVLATLLARTATRLHSLTRAEAGARKGSEVWPAWASLQNASRSAVLQASTCRDLAARLGGGPSRR
jgi:hypothetical protein